MKDTDSNTLARIDERTSALTTSLAVHVKEDGDRFDKVFSFVSKRFDSIDSKLDTLWDEKNQRKGALVFSKMISGAVGGLIVIMSDYFLPWHR